ncbi:phage holin family protein [Enterococcus sp. AZ109]|uniref:phage holin family protein n=1 Tax=Enterococcus sp. AZ109 TaxID=2774634 RepID=UPI003F295E28
MLDILELLKSQLSKMCSDGSWIMGAAGGGLSLAIPQWVTAKELGIQHGVLMAILLAIFVLEWIVGHRLARASTAKRKESGIMIDSAIRDFVIVMICMIAYGFDYLFGSGSVIFCLFTFAFIYHNFYSLLANVVVLGWGDKFPMWLLNWLQDEIEAKKDKYFPTPVVDADDQENNVR